MSGIAEGLFAEQDDPRSYKKLVTVEDLIKFEDGLPTPSPGGSLDANHGNVAYVSVDGNDLTGVVGNISKPFESLQAAIDALDSGSNGQVIIISSSSFGQNITSLDMGTTHPYGMLIHNFCDCDINFTGTGGRQAGQLTIITQKTVLFNITGGGTFNVDDYFNIQCKSVSIPGTHACDFAFTGFIECEVFTVNSNANNPSLDFDRILWKNSITVNEPITYNRCNPMVWKGYLKQNGTSSPLATVIENSLGETLTFTYNFAGSFTINSVGGKFSTTKTLLSSTPSENAGGSIFPHISYQVTSSSAIDIECYEAVGFALGDFLGVTIGTLIEIEIYP